MDITQDNIIFFDSNSDKDLLIDLCREAMEDDMPGSQNLSLDDWEFNPASLLYKIYIEKVYDEKNKGRFVGVLDDDQKLILVFGSMRWDRNPNVCLMPTRLYLRKDHRGYGQAESYTKRFEQVQRRMNQECVKLGYKATLITHNQYNVFLREATYRDSREGGYMIFEYYDHPVLVNHTKQWAMYHLFDGSYEQDLIKSLDSSRT